MAAQPDGTPNSMWKLTLCYDGGPFAGWQVQPGQRTVQGELARAIARVTGERVLPQGSGRTDAGVHALAQVASVQLKAPIKPQNLIRALNNVLPQSVRILGAEHAPLGFHARHSAIRKTYEYRILRNRFCPPWQAPYVCSYTFPLALKPMQQAAEAVLGRHDFLSFQAQDQDKTTKTAKTADRARRAAGESSTVKTLFSSIWETHSEGLLVYRVCGSGFLHHMVRNLVGTFLDVGRGRIAPEALPGILQARARAAAGPTAPASGLWLHSVEYS